MGLTPTMLAPQRYGALCADVIPRVIRDDAEFDRLAGRLEELHFQPNPSLEETELAALLAQLIENYDRPLDGQTKHQQSPSPKAEAFL